MSEKTCLNDQELILHYYGEQPETDTAAAHLDTCSQCRARLENLARDLDRLPELQIDIDPAAGTRVAARVTERLRHRPRHWLPLAGGALAAASAVVLTITMWQTAPVVPKISPTTDHDVEFALSSEDLPELDFLDDLELLEDLELLRQIEGV